MAVSDFPSAQTMRLVLCCCGANKDAQKTKMRAKLDAMFTVHDRILRRLGALFPALCAVMAFCLGSATDVLGQPGPLNTNLANARGIFGSSGTIYGTNLGVTLQTQADAPAADPFTNQYSIWYSWTAPITTTIEFNTRGSTDPNGKPLDTVLAVYTLKPGATTVTLANLELAPATLPLVATNDNDPNPAYPLTSRVDFPVTLGTQYFIQVDGGRGNTPGTNAQGYVTLNWESSLVAGGFGFAATYFAFGSLEDYLIDNDGTISPSLYGIPAGSGNARVTVTRSGGYTGKCELTLMPTNNFYTNYYYTNWIITNIFITNYATNVGNPPPLSWTNLYITNIYSINYFANDEYGNIGYLPLDGYTLVSQTNLFTSGPPPVTQMNPPFTSAPILATFGLPDFFTNFPCPDVFYNIHTRITNGVTNGNFPPSLPPELPVIEAESYTATNLFATNGSIFTTTVSNVICIQGFVTNVSVPAAFAGIHYTANNNALTFNDYQMSQDVFLQVDPLFASYAPGTPKQDVPIPGPEDAELPTTDPNYVYNGLNASVNLTLTNAVLDSNEDLSIIPPTIGQTNADMNILNYYGNPNPVYTNNFGNAVVINVERQDIRVNRPPVIGDFYYVTLWVQTYPRYRQTSYVIHYTLDSLNEDGDVADWNTWPTVADADYAVPEFGQPVADWGAPDTGWTGWDGELTFPAAPDIAAQPISIPIFNNGSQEFDEDILVQLFYAPGDAASDIGATPPGYLGNTFNVHLTVNFDNTADNLQPGGAVDRNWNIDNQATSVPPNNPSPGANGGVGAAVEAVAIQPNGEAVIGGYFNSYNDTNVYGIARLLANGFLDTSFATGTGVNNGFVDAIVIDAAGRIIIGGAFASYNNNNSVNNIARLNSNGSLDTTFNSGVGFNGPVYGLAIDASGNILVGGDFTSYNTTNCNHIARLLPSGGLDSTFLPNTGNGNTNYGTDQAVEAVATDGNGNVILGGAFAHVNGSKLSYLARLLPGGALDPAFNPEIGPDGVVYSLAIQPNNEIVIGGAFQNYNLVSRSSVAQVAFNGSLDTTFNPGSGANGTIYSVVIQPDGNVLLGGQFTSINTTRRIGVARLLANGWLDTSFMDTSYNQFAGLINVYYTAPPNTAYALGLESSGNIIVGGSFTNVGGGSTRVDVHPRVNVAQIIGASTVGYGDATLTYEPGGIGNCPGNITFTQNPYEGLDTQGGVFVTLQRLNGSLGPAAVTLGTNTLPPGPGNATSADYGLDLPEAVATYDDLWDIYQNNSDGGTYYGWRVSDGFYGYNNVVQPENDNGASAMELLVFNDLTISDNLFADLSLLNLNSYGLLTLGGVVIPTGPALGVPGSQLEILNNNAPVGIVGYSAANYTTVNTSNQVTITVLRTNGSSGDISIYYWTADGTARVGNGDYTATTGKLSFNAGVTAASFNVQIGDFSTVQPTKYFNLYFSNAAPASILSSNAAPLFTNATVTIIDGNFAPGHLSFTTNSYSVSKGGVATVSVMRSGGALGQLTVECGTSNGTAINGLNYTGVTNALTWGNQDVSTKTMAIQTLQDNTVDGNLTSYVYLFNATNTGSTNNDGLILNSPSNASLTIDEVNSYGNFSFAVPNFEALQTAGQALITVVRTGGTTGTVVLGYATSSDTNAPLVNQAQAGTNFGEVSSPPLTALTFGPGVTSQSFVVPISNTPPPLETNEANRLVSLQLQLEAPAATNLSNPAISNLSSQFPVSGTLTILDPQLVLNPPGSVDVTTQNGTGFNNVVSSLALQPDGSLLAGGDFTFFNQYPFNYVGRLNPNGSFDIGFLFNQVGANSNVLQVLTQTTNSSQTNNGPVVIVGQFNQVDGVNRNGIARLNLDGSLDETFNPGSGADSTILAVAEAVLPAGLSGQPNTLAYYIAGSFANFDGVPSGGITRLNGSTNSPGLQGTVDPDFNVGQGLTGSNAIIRTLAVQANNQVIAGGDFTSFNSANYDHLVRLNVDGSVDTTFNPSTGSDPEDSVRAIVVQPDGKIIVGGSFTNVNGTNFNYLARLNPDGSVDTNFNVGFGGNNSVLTLALDSQQRILVGGEFTRFSGVTRSGLTRLNPDGTVDPTINFGTGADGGSVDAITIQTNDEIDVGGQFSTFEGISENNFVRLYGLANSGNGSIQFSQPVFGVLEGATNATITLQRLGGEGTNAEQTVSVVFGTSDGTAQAGVNYTAVTTNITFPFGETFETVTIPITNNLLVGSNLIVNLNLSNAVLATIGAQASAILIITNVNSAVSFSSQAYNQTADAPSGEAIIPIVRIGYPNSTVGVTVYTGTNGTAGPNTNYIPITNFLVFNPGVMTNYFDVPILNSPNMFSDLTVDLEMGSPSNTYIGSPSSATLTIDSVYTASGVVTFSQTNYSVLAPSTGGGTNAVITILRTNGSSGAVSVTLTTSNGTAIAGVEYSNVQTIVSFADTEVSKTVNIPILVQSNVGPATTVYLTLSNPQNTSIGGAAQEILTIQNDIEYFSFATSPYFVGEGAGTVTLGIVRGGPAGNAASVSYSTADLPNASHANGDALSNIDYVPASGTLNYAPNETFSTIPITILQGNSPNVPLSFDVNLTTTTSNVQIGAPSQATVIILSDVTAFEFATNAYAVAESGSNIVVTVTRSNPNTGTASVQFATSDGTNQNSALNAVNQVDYISTNGTLIFSNGVASNSFIVPILNPNVVESSKTFNLTLSNPKVLTLPNPSTNAYLLSPSNATVTITNVLAGVSFGSPAFSVSECGVLAAIPVVLTGVTNNLVSVSCKTIDGAGTAIAGTNYFSASTNFTFLPGQTTTNFYVQVINDHIIGPNHTVVIGLSDPEGAQLISPSTAVLTIEECNGAYIVGSGTAFVSGSTPNSGGVIFSNETVTVLFGLRNVAGNNTTNLVATLLATNGVTLPSGPQSYGVLITNGPTVARPFTFTAVGTNGQNITAILALMDGSEVYSNVAFGFTLGGQSTTFSTNETLILYGSNNFQLHEPPSKASDPKNPPNYGYPSSITVSGIEGNVTAVTMAMTNFGHTFTADVALVLQSPGGQNVLLMSDCGGTNGSQPGGKDTPGISLTFSQSATNYLPEVNPITAGTYLPTYYGYADALPTNGPGQPQAPLMPFSTNLSIFAGQPANGTWYLWAADDDSLDMGYISNGWILTISTGLPVGEDADLEMSLTATTANATQGNALTYTIGVTNYGPAAATNVVITDTLPSGVTFVSDSFGATPGTNGVLTDTVATMAVSNGVTLTIQVIPTNTGYITNIAAAISSEPDPNSNNMETNIALVSPASADLGVGLSDSPNPVMNGGDVTYTIVVYNNGPSTATGIVATNVLPAGFLPVTITPAPASTNNGIILWNMGSLGIGLSATNTIVAEVFITNRSSLPSSSSLDTATVGGSVYDPAKLNNFASVKTEVEPSLLTVGSSGTNHYSLSWPVVSTNIMLYGAVNLSGPWAVIQNPTPVGGIYTYVLSGSNGYHFFSLGLKLP
jgi:uncharacterized repeat protein (TIGR01451 family)/uncharacterized delta-60 repeat protein